MFFLFFWGNSKTLNVPFVKKLGSFVYEERVASSTPLHIFFYKWETGQLVSTKTSCESHLV